MGKWVRQEKKRYYIDEAKAEKIILLDRELMKVETSLEVEAIESLWGEKKRVGRANRAFYGRDFDIRETIQDVKIKPLYNWR